MKNIKLLCLLAIAAVTFACTDSEGKNADMQQKTVVTESTRDDVIKALIDSLGSEHSFRIERGVNQVADLWRKSDGSEADFKEFCLNSFVADKEELNDLYNKLERNFEILNGYFHKIAVKLQEPLQLEGDPIQPIDLIFGGYNASAHLGDDLFKNKIALITALNFPFYSLDEKTEQGDKWSRLEWAYARMGDQFTTRVPADISQNISETLTIADAYISDYNICMDKLVNDKGEQLFPDGLKLISHWGLRDELKSNYADIDNNLEKQRMVYKVMQRIIDQTIPLEVINSDEYTWNPFSNEISKNGKVEKSHPEDLKRYQVFLDNFHAMRQLDRYSTHYPTQLDRAFAGSMEIPQKDVVKLFDALLSSPQVKQVAELISNRLGRPLEPFDIWYNRFTSGEAIPEAELDRIVSAKYPNAKAVKADLPNILVKLGWKRDVAEKICSLVEVDVSRGAGHAWGAEMRNDEARLRTRIGENGMDYKGYNIAVHEFGHNVEQTLTMNQVDYYMLHGVPNTSFTEAVAFLFQQRDLDLLGLKNPNPDDAHFLALDNFWSCYEIMGVSLVDIKVWEWLYANPDADAEALKGTVLAISKEVWNKYYAGILGDRDQTLLGIYSHMIDYPLYLPNYPMGHLINFQLEQQVAGKNLADEITRMYTVGSLVPQVWMQNAVESDISIKPLLNAVDKALEVIK